MGCAGRRHQSGGELPHRVRQRGARKWRGWPDQGAADQEQFARPAGLSHPGRSAEEMIRREGERMMVSGALTLASVAADLAQGRSAIAEGVRSVDLAEAGELDS